MIKDLRIESKRVGFARESMLEQLKTYYNFMVRFRSGRDDHEVVHLTTCICFAYVSYGCRIRDDCIILSLQQTQEQWGICCCLLLYYLILFRGSLKVLLSFKLVNFISIINKTNLFASAFFPEEKAPLCICFSWFNFTMLYRDVEGAPFRAGGLQALAKHTASSLVFLTLIKLLMLLTS